MVWPGVVSHQEDLSSEIFKGPRLPSANIGVATKMWLVVAERQSVICLE